MLYHIPNIITPDLLRALHTMGHGDEVAIVDANFPAASLHRQCLRLSGVNTPDALTAILKLFPVDRYVDNPFITMEVVPGDKPDQEAIEAMEAIARPFNKAHQATLPLERFAFYERAKQCFAIVQTSELRPYGNIIVKKGVINDSY